VSESTEELGSDNINFLVFNAIFKHWKEQEAEAESTDASEEEDPSVEMEISVTDIMTDGWTTFAFSEYLYPPEELLGSINITAIFEAIGDPSGGRRLQDTEEYDEFDFDLGELGDLFEGEIDFGEGFDDQ